MAFPLHQTTQPSSQYVAYQQQQFAPQNPNLRDPNHINININSKNNGSAVSVGLVDAGAVTAAVADASAGSTPQSQQFAFQTGGGVGTVAPQRAPSSQYADNTGPQQQFYPSAPPYRDNSISNISAIQPSPRRSASFASSPNNSPRHPHHPLLSPSNSVSNNLGSLQGFIMSTPPQTMAGPAAVFNAASVSTPQAPTSALQSPTIAQLQSTSEALLREQDRVSLLLSINQVLLMEVVKMQQQGEGGDVQTPTNPKAEEGKKDEKSASKDYVDFMRRMQANLAYLANVAEAPKRPANPNIPWPPIMIAPTSGPASLIHMYTKLHALFPDWKG